VIAAIQDRLLIFFLVSFFSNLLFFLIFQIETRSLYFFRILNLVGVFLKLKFQFFSVRLIALSNSFSHFNSFIKNLTKSVGISSFCIISNIVLSFAMIKYHQNDRSENR